ncbi:TPA: DUF334 domain-containing protein [Staphylococcus aureus]|uniref:DUF334 domain-containing protein n=2 Tax=Staphylococcus aureus TaxID=1280 RepID=UPI000BA1A686|nr:DUF334 domain-containing protein [Staphylococcus aureus]NGS81410.1 DUF334 domain-containing protein [Staphylococcus aureus]OZW60000.1 hypothetical protein AFP17_14590 [Staphylococcus aureus]HDZ6554703.1 DUF334 domain-containing protein [Staphylococcus aureus]
MKETMKDFQDNSIKTHNDFVHLLREKLNDVETQKIQDEMTAEIRKIKNENEKLVEEFNQTHEAYKKRIKLMYYSVSAILLVFMFFALIMTIGSDFMAFLHMDILQKAIASKIESSEGFWTLVWYIAYGIPYVLGIGLFIVLYEWIKISIRNRF